MPQMQWLRNFSLLHMNQWLFVFVLVSAKQQTSFQSGKGHWPGKQVDRLLYTASSLASRQVVGVQTTTSFSKKKSSTAFFRVCSGCCQATWVFGENGLIDCRVVTHPGLDISPNKVSSDNKLAQFVPTALKAVGFWSHIGPILLNWIESCYHDEQ